MDLKVILIGDTGVGKTTLVRCCCVESPPNPTTPMGIDRRTKTITREDKTVTLQVWDTAGQEFTTSAFFKGAKGAMLVYDVTKKVSFENIESYLEELKEYASPPPVFMLVGNKCDVGEASRTVTVEIASAFAVRNGMLFLETSALDGANVEKAFEMITTQVVARAAQV